MLRDPRDTGWGSRRVDSYLLGNGVANDDVAFWDVPGHSGRVGSEVSDCHIHRRWRPVHGRQCVNRLPGSTPKTSSDDSSPAPFYSPAAQSPGRNPDQQEDCGA